MKFRQNLGIINNNQNNQDDNQDNQSEKSDREAVEISSDLPNDEIENTVSCEIKNEKSMATDRARNLLISLIVMNGGVSALSGQRFKCSAPWKDHILREESISARLLTSLARILLYESNKGCACISLNEKKICVAVNSGVKKNKRNNYDGDIEKVIRKLASETHSLGSAENIDQKKEIIESIRKCWREMIRRAAFKDKNIFSEIQESFEKKNNKESEESEEEESEKKAKKNNFRKNSEKNEN